MRNVRRMGKSEARTKFLPLVQAIVASGETVEITDHGKVAVVLMSHQEYLRLLSLARENPDPTRSPVGTMVVLQELEGDNCTTDILNESLRRRAGGL